MWANKPSPISVLVYLQNKQKDFYQANFPQRPKHFIEYQGVVTPSAEDMLSRYRMTFKEAMADEMTRYFISWLENPNQTNLPTGTLGVCMADFVNKRFVDAVLSYNSFQAGQGPSQPTGNAIIASPNAGGLPSLSTTIQIMAIIFILLI